jgi:hypothetical protein
MPPDKRAGKASSFTLNSVKIPMRKYTPKTTRKLVDTTDSEDYDTATDMLYASQVPVMVSQELTVEGNLDLNTTPSSLWALLYSGAAAVPAVLGIDAGHLCGSGNYDISDFTTNVPIDDKVDWTATFKLNGKFTPGT